MFPCVTEHGVFLRISAGPRIWCPGHEGFTSCLPSSAAASLTSPRRWKSGTNVWREADQTILPGICDWGTGAEQHWYSFQHTPGQWYS